MASGRLESATAPLAPVLGCLGPQWSSGFPQPVFSGFICGRLFWRPLSPEKSSANGQQLVHSRLYSPELPIPPAAGEDARSALGEAKKKNLSEGFLQPPLTSFSREHQPPAGARPKSGKVPPVLSALLNLEQHRRSQWN